MSKIFKKLSEIDESNLLVKQFGELNINIYGTYTDPLFKAKDIGDLIGISKIRDSLKNLDDEDKILKGADTTGGLQEQYFITENGLYELLFISRKPVAKEFKKWVKNIIKEIRLTGEYKLKNELENAQKHIKEKEIELNDIKDNIINNMEMQKEQTLLSKFGNSGNLVYIIKIHTFEDNKYIIKIGETRENLANRLKEHRTNYNKNIVLLDCFVVYNSKCFEKYLHTHPEISTNRVDDFKKHEMEKELFLIGHSLSYKKLLKIINDEIRNFNNIENIINDKKLLEEKYDNLLKTTKIIDVNTDIKNFINEKVDEIKIQNTQNFNILKEEMEELKSKIISMNERTTSNFNIELNTIGQRVQKINPETMTLIQTYETIADCVRQNSTLTRSGLEKSIRECYVYRDYRWAYHNREHDINTLTSNLQPTKKTKMSVVLGYIAKMNSTKTEIENVYIDRKTASLKNGYNSATLDENVKNNTIKNGKYYVIYDELDDSIKEEFCKKHNIKKVCLYVSGVGIYKNDELIDEQTSKLNVRIQYKIGEKTLNKALNTGLKYKELLFKELGKKEMI